MNNNYWVDFWKTLTKHTGNKDEQTQVLRTLDKVPISKELWGFTLHEIDKYFKINTGDKILDLCAGNGLFAKHFVAKGCEVTAVDISSELLKNLESEQQIETILSDIRTIEFGDESFNHVFLYAGIQYLSEKEAIELMIKIYGWLKPNGILYIGDIPDFKKRWIFFDNQERRKVYFTNKLEEKAIVGNWFEKGWFKHLADFIGFQEEKYIQQHEKLIYSKFRFDYYYKK